MTIKDVSDLGFVLDPEESFADRNLFEYNNFGLILLSNNFITVYKFNDYDERIVFEGCIKNKQELKILFRQLGIYESN